MRWLAVLSASGCLAGAAARAETVVLDTTGFWRMYHILKPPVIQHSSGLRPMDLRWTIGDRIVQSFPWAERETPPPPADWMRVEFDDSAWMRAPARMSCQTALLSRLCLRGYFAVSDPARVGGLQLDVAYRGGVIVYLNGREIGRRDVEPDSAGRERLARGYPAEAFTPPGGWSGRDSDPGRDETDAEIALRRRTAAIAIPAAGLRAGVNVLAIEVIRAPYHSVLEEMKGRRGSRYCPYYTAFNTCQIERVQLKSPNDSGLASRATRPEGFQVWNTNPLAADYDLDYGDPAPLRPLRLAGARNGSYSGKVGVGSRRPLRGLRAVASDLAGAGGATIPAAALRIRYGLPGGREAGVNGQRTIYQTRVSAFRCYPRAPTLLGTLDEEPPEEVPVRVVPPGPADLNLPGQPEPVFGAVAPVWVTVNIPRNIPPGVYRGEITIRADGETPVRVPVEVAAMEYTLPEPNQYRTLFELIQSPDTLALEYGVEPWSDRHFELIARSLRLMREAGVQVVYVPVIAETNLGNAQSLVRFVPDGGKSFRFDFAVMDRYLDLVEANLGKPRVLCFVVWDIYLGGDGGGYKDTWGHNQPSVELRKQFIGLGPRVTLLDPDTGTVRTGHLPAFSDPASPEIWRRLFGELRRRMARRGLESAMMLGLMSDDWPTDEENAFFREASGGLNWVSHSHIPVTQGGRKLEDGRIILTGATSRGSARVDREGFRVAYHSAVFNCVFPDEARTAFGSLRGWMRSDLGAYQPRYETFQPASRWRHLMELNVAGGQRGVARGGADFWPAVRDSRGQRRGTVADRYPQSAWRNLNIPWTLLAPGRSGAAATHHFEAVREGIQECQARIRIEEALSDDALRARLGEPLARRCEELLLERTHFMLQAISHLQVNNAWGHLTGPEPLARQISVMGHRWFVGSGWQERSMRLYALAGEVERRLGAR